MTRPVRVVNYGGGVNSTALLCECVERSIKIDLVVFADTGSEMPHTYGFIELFNKWLIDHDMPPVISTRWIRKSGKFVSLHEWCESDNRVPSRAYGMSGCTTKWKQQPADLFVRNHALVEMEHTAGRTVERWIGYDADEPERAERMLEKSPQPDLWVWKAPLLEWDMGRDECLKSIQKAGLPSPGKSSCWMCPSMRKPEILAIKDQYPELLERALKMESRAIAAGNLGTKERQGLGGRMNWSQFLRTGEGVDPTEVACGCYDGEPVQIRLPGV